MKKSKGIRLVLLGAAGLVMPSCDETPLPPKAQFSPASRNARRFKAG